MQRTDRNETALARSRALARSTQLATALAVVVLVLTGCHRRQTEISDPQAPKIEGEQVSFPADAPQLRAISVETAEPRKLAVSHLTGRLYWDEDKTVRVFTPAGGRVKSVLADIGETIAAGAPLAEIDSPDFAQALATARTAVANLTAAERTYVRSRDLAEHGAAAPKDVEAAEATFKAAAAERTRALEQLANYGGDIASTNSLYRLRSPIAGVLVERTINAGQELRPDMMLGNAPPLFVVSDPRTLWLQLDVAETDLPALVAGLPLRLTSRVFPGKTFDGTLTKIGDTLDPATRTVRVRGVVSNPEKLLKAEMYVLADVVQDTSRASDAGVALPSGALFLRDNDYYVFVEESPGQFERQKVTVGVEADGTVPVLAGVAAGQKVVSEGALLLQALLESSS